MFKKNFFGRGAAHKPAHERPQGDTTLYHFVIDRSSSMSGMERFVEEGFNTQLQTLRSLSQQFPEREFSVSLTYFNQDVERRVSDGGVNHLRPLRSGEYQPDGNTALLDAMGSAISATRQLYDMRQRRAEVSAVVVVITDGEENASRHYNDAAIARMVKDCEATGRWTFTFLGADFDASAMAERVSLSKKHCMKFDKVDFAVTMDKLSQRMEVYEHSKSDGLIMKSLFDVGEPEHHEQENSIESKLPN